MTDLELEALMREYDAEVAAYKRLPQSEPTAFLDRAVLTKARAAVAHTHKPPRFLAMAASFAGVAIAAGIGWRVHVANEETRNAVNDASARGEVFEVDVMPNSTRDRQKALEMAQLPAPPPPPPAPAAPPALDDAKREAEAFASGPALRAQAAPAEQNVAAPAAKRVAEPEPFVRADHASRDGAPGQRRNVAATSAEVSAAAAAPASVPAVATEMMADTAASDAPAGIASDQRERKESDALDKLALGKDDRAATPTAEDWIKRIRRMVRERKIDEARVELRNFRAHYPDTVVPVDLRRYAP